MEKGKEQKAARWRESETRLMNMIRVCAAAHPCVELVHSDNRVHWGTLFMLLIWLHAEKEAESCLDSIKKVQRSLYFVFVGDYAERESLLL